MWVLYLCESVGISSPPLFVYIVNKTHRHHSFYNALINGNENLSTALFRSELLQIEILSC